MVDFRRIQSTNQIDVWVLPLPTDLTELDMSWANPAEILGRSDLIRYHRFKVITKKREMIISRLFLRWLLNKYVPDYLYEIQIKPDEFGKPFLYRAQEKLPLYFTLSHTLGMMIYVFSLSEMIGADVEYLNQSFSFEVEGIFSPEEVSWCKSGGKLSEKKYLTVWTLKEAFLKAVGQGFLTPFPPDSFWFSFDDNSIKINFKRTCERDYCGLWHFRSSVLRSEYILSHAVKSKSVPLLNCCNVSLKELGIPE